jgi:hypothetical protein
MMHTGYAKRPQLSELSNVINFDLPNSYNSYKESGGLITDEAGSVLSLTLAENDGEMDFLHLL